MQDLESINQKIKKLDHETKDMLKEDDRERPWVLQQFKLMSQIDHVKAIELLKSKAVGEMMEWSNEPVQSMKQTEFDWQKIWTENQELEKLIYEEEKGYRIENANIIKAC